MLATAADMCFLSDYVQAQGVRFLPLAGRHMTAAMCSLMQQRHARARFGLDGSGWASAAQCPATFYLVHELLPVEVALLQGTASSSGCVSSLLCFIACRAKQACLCCCASQEAYDGFHHLCLCRCLWHLAALLGLM